MDWARELLRRENLAQWQTHTRREFHEAMLNITKSAWSEWCYRATLFLHMVIEKGGLATAKRLLASDQIQSGLNELYHCDRLDLSMESPVLQPKFKELFTAEELAEARRRMDKLQRKS